MKNKLITLNVAFGKEVADSFHYGKSLTEDQILMNVKKYEFSSQKEAKSFLSGISEAMGWQDYYVLDKSEIKKIQNNCPKEAESKRIS